MDPERKLENGLANLVTRGVVDRSDPDGALGNVMGMSGRLAPEVELLQPQGVHFRLPAGAEGVRAALGGEHDNTVLVAASERSEIPLDPLLQEGEGGLHFEGVFKVFLAADGTIHLGGKYELLDVADYVALASKVDQQLARLMDALTNATVTPGDGGATLLSSILLSLTVPLPAWPVTVASEVVKAK